MAASEGARRLRLNIVAYLSSQAVAKFLIVVEEESGMEALYTKAQQVLRRTGLHATIVEVRNSFQALVPTDEFLGDIFRDGEEVVVVLRGQDGHLMEEQPPRFDRGQEQPRLLAPLAPRREQFVEPATRLAPHDEFGQSAARILPVTAHVTLPEFHDESEPDEEEDEAPLAPAEEDYPPRPVGQVPGPTEDFEMERMPYETMQVDHPCDPVQLGAYDDSWLVEHLTPRLRDFIISRFQPDLITEPKYVASIGKYVGAKFRQTCGAFVSVFMRPQTALKSDPSATMPVHYNIPKSELFMFMRKVEVQIEELQKHQEVLSASLRALRALLAKGMAESDLVAVMLPLNYHAFAEVEGSMIEAEQPLPMAAGRHPVVIIDTSGAVAEHLIYVKAAVKRALHTHMGCKSSFQLVRFRRGEPRLWAQDMMAPTEKALQAAEDWIDRLEPTEYGNLVEAVRFALAFKNCDEICIISSASAYRHTEHEKVLANVRSVNKREVAIHTTGVEPDPHGELLLRSISESNHGDFTLKSFQDQGDARRDMQTPSSATPEELAERLRVGRANVIPGQDSKWTSWRTMLVNEKTKKLSESFKQQKMSIGSQVNILAVMLREEGQFEESWRQEWTCAQQLLAKVPECPDRDMVRELERNASQTISARVGGGFIYHTRQMELGMEKLFEHRGAKPWSAESESTAVGPKVPWPDAEGRSAKFPAADEMPLASQESEAPAMRKAPKAWAPGRDALRASTLRRSVSRQRPDSLSPMPKAAELRSPSDRRAQPGQRRMTQQRRPRPRTAASPARPRPASRERFAAPKKMIAARTGGGFIYQQVRPPRPPSPPEMGPAEPLERRWSF
ncbi:unnamed protein product [Effrenium voratum]|uniref:VWFA domain-containing protein n=1 Tax=Effrenium voratum TaxID=2562239 RepID=A0AA36J5P6_9DINO|nr:unnamed protein product [Effrenium voratum]CAJ1458619.1 unnamed protein product [Effrenium voratum]